MGIVLPATRWAVVTSRTADIARPYGLLAGSMVKIIVARGRCRQSATARLYSDSIGLFAVATGVFASATLASSHPKSTAIEAKRPMLAPADKTVARLSRLISGTWVVWAAIWKCSLTRVSVDAWRIPSVLQAVLASCDGLDLGQQQRYHPSLFSPWL